MNDTQEKTIWDERKPRIWLVGRTNDKPLLDDSSTGEILHGKKSWMSSALDYVRDMILSCEDFPDETGLSLDITIAHGEWFYVEIPYIVNRKPYDDYGKYFGELMRLRIECSKIDDYSKLFEFSPPIRNYEIPEVGSSAWEYWFSGLCLYMNIREKNDQLAVDVKEFCDRCIKRTESLI